MPLKCPKLVKRSRMIRETAHNATVVKSKKTTLKLTWMRDIRAFARRDQSPNANLLEWAAIFGSRHHYLHQSIQARGSVRHSYCNNDKFA
jgi:hypothetical protein